jgi:hypothetical protein
LINPYCSTPRSGIRASIELTAMRLPIRRSTVGQLLGWLGFGTHSEASKLSQAYPRTSVS